MFNSRELDPWVKATIVGILNIRNHPDLAPLRKMPIIVHGVSPIFVGLAYPIAEGMNDNERTS